MTSIVPDLASLVQVQLGWGRDRARSIGAVAEAMNLSRRAVEKAIENLRVRGEPICSGPDGVWLSTDGVELMAQYEALRRRAVGQLVNARAMRATARRYGKVRQMEMFG